MINLARGKKNARIANLKRGTHKGRSASSGALKPQGYISKQAVSKLTAPLSTGAMRPTPKGPEPHLPS